MRYDFIDNHSIVLNLLIFNILYHLHLKLEENPILFITIFFNIPKELL